MNEIAGICDSSASALVLIDVQERLAAAMPAGDLDAFIRNASILTRAAALLQIPVLRTEQYPKGLGTTVPELKQHLPDAASCYEKTGFSCCAAQGFSRQLDRLQRKQLVLTGMETHICVLQTAMELRQQGFDVFVVEDAVCARSPQRSANGLARLRRMGVTVSYSESVIFEWLRDARHPHFKAVSGLLK